MNAHTPFDAKQDWSNPYCQNSSNDQIVDSLLGNAYHVVRTVYCNLGNLKLLYDFLNQYGMVIGVQSEAELKALTADAKYARIYGFSRAGDRQVTDYLYVEGDRTGILPDDTTATGSWVTAATSGSNSGGTSSGDGAYIPWVYNKGSAIGGETTINVPDGTVGVPFIIINGDMQYVGRGFEFNVDSLSVTLAQSLEEGDEVVFLLTGVPAVPDNPYVNDWVQINWLYNNGAAVGGEQVIAIPYTFQSVPAVYKNGLRLYKGLTTESYTTDPDNQRILLTEPLATNDRLIVQIGGEARVLEASDYTLQEVARAANVKDSEVILSTDTTQVLNGKKIIYDVVSQHIYGLPTIPTNVYITSVSDGQLTYSPGNITVTLLDSYQQQNTRELWRRSLVEAGLTLVDGSFEEGTTVNSKEDAVWHIAAGQCYYWEGALPKTIPASSSPANTGGVADGAWRSVGTSAGDGSQLSVLASGSTTPRTLADRFADVVYVEDFGLIGDGVTFNDAAWKTLIDYIKPLPSKPIIEFGHGEFIFEEDGILSYPSNGQGTGLTIRGVSRRDTVIKMSGSNKSLYNNGDNNRNWAFVTFVDIGFKTTDRATGGLFNIWSNGFEQGFTFVRCGFSEAYDAVTIRGTANGSEMKYDHCKFYNLGGSVYVLANPQSVNHQFSSCDAELYDGDLFKTKAGGGVNWYGGSIIPSGGTESWLVHLTNQANTSVGTGNGDFNFYGIRTELRGIKKKLVGCFNPSQNDYIKANFYSCNLSVVTGGTREAVKLKNGSTVMFHACAMPKEFTYTVDGIDQTKPLGGLLLMDKCRDYTSLSSRITSSGFGGAIVRDVIYSDTRTSPVIQMASSFYVNPKDIGSGVNVQPLSVQALSAASGWPFNGGKVGIGLPKGSIIMSIELHKPALAGATTNNMSFAFKSIDGTVTYATTTPKPQRDAHTERIVVNQVLIDDGIIIEGVGGLQYQSNSGASYLTVTYM